MTPGRGAVCRKARAPCAGVPWFPLLQKKQSKCVAVMDVKSAFLYGRAPRPIFIEVPAEDSKEPFGRSAGKIGGIIVLNT